MLFKRLCYFQIVLVSLVFCIACASVESTLKAPIGYYKAIEQGKGDKKNSEYICKGVPVPFMGSLQFFSKYTGSGSARDELNKIAERKYRAATANINRFEKSSVKFAMNYLLGKPGIASRECLVQWLDGWAKAGALLSTDTNHTGMSVRKWALASISSAYFLTKVAEGAPPMSKLSQQRIESWLAKLAEQVVVDWSNRPLKKRNNHDYWAAWAVMITGVTLNRQDFFDWARHGLTQGLSQIDDSGFLPNELRRKTRALLYHNYSLAPLVMLAVFSESNAVILTDKERLSLSNLVRVTMNGLENPAEFEAITGVEQITNGVKNSYALAWIEPYAGYFAPKGQFDAYFSTHRPMMSTRMGGNMTRIFSVPMATSNP